jgi:molecular chaperone DnaK
MAEIRSAQEELTRVFSEAGQTFYAQQGNAGAPGEGDGTPQGDGQPAGATAGRADDVVEADYEIVDDKK